MIGDERRAGRGDVDDDFRSASGGRAFRGAEAFNDPVIIDPMRLEEAARLGDVFRCDPQALAGARAMLGADVGEIGHRLDVEPRHRRRNDQVGAPEAERLDEYGWIEPERGFAQHVLAGDADVHIAFNDRPRNVGCGQQAHFDVRNGVDPRRIPS